MSESAAYDIVGVSGRGRFGVVYKADGPDGPVALKRAVGTWEDFAAHRVLGKAVRSIGHSALDAPITWLRQAGEDWAVLAWIDGFDLGALEQPAPLRPALQILVAAASGLGALREHRTSVPWPPDLRPQHVRVSADGKVHLVDLWHGKVDLKDEERTRWLAPEVLRKRPMDAADVYSLGAVVAELLGAASIGPPERNARRHEVQVSVALDSLEEQGVPEGVVGLLAHMLAFKPAERPTPADLVVEGAELAEESEGPTLEEWAAEVANEVWANEASDVVSRIGARIRDEGGWDEAVDPDRIPTAIPEATRMPRQLTPVSSPTGAVSVEELAATDDEVDQTGDSPTADTLETDQTADTIDELPATVDYDDEQDLQDNTGPFREALDPELIAAAVASPPPPEPSLPPVAEVEEESASMVWIGAGMGIGLLVVLAIGWALVWGPLSGSSTPEADPVPVAPATPPEPEPEPAPEPAPEPSEAPAPEAAPEGTDEPEPTPEPAPTTEPSPAPERSAPPPPRTRVEVDGDAIEVWLVSGSRRYAVPGPVRGGAYKIEARFEGFELVDAGSVEVPSSGSLKLACNSMFKRCAIP